MQWFKNLNIGVKLLISNSILSLLILLLAAISIQRLDVIDKNVTNVGESLYAIDILLQANRDYYQVLVAERSMIFATPNSKKFGMLVEDHAHQMAKARQHVDTFMSYQHDPRIDELFSSYQSALVSWQPLTERVRSARQEDSPAERQVAIELSFGSAEEAFNNMLKQIDAMVEYTELYADDAIETTSASVESTQKTTLTLLIISIAVAILIAMLFPRFIVGPIKEMTMKINELAKGEGDLTSKVAVTASDEVGLMGNSVNKFLESLRVLVSQIIDTESEG